MNNYKDLIMAAVFALTQIGLVTPVFIEVLKNLIGEEKIVKIFGKMEIFSVVFSAVLGVVTLIGVALFIPSLFDGFTIGQSIFIGIAFVIATAVGSQVSYDKVIKWLLSLIQS